MKKLEIKDDITEEKILDLIKFLDTGELPEGMTKSKMFYLYGRLKARGEKIDKAEELLKPCYEKKKENYKRKILNEIKQWNEDMRNESRWIGHYEYEMVNIKHWDKWRTMQIWFSEIDMNNKQKRLHSVVLKERENPEFFREMLEKYKPQEIEEPALKPF